MSLGDSGQWSVKQPFKNERSSDLTIEALLNKIRFCSKETWLPEEPYYIVVYVVYRNLL